MTCSAGLIKAGAVRARRFLVVSWLAVHTPCAAIAATHIRSQSAHKGADSSHKLGLAGTSNISHKLGLAGTSNVEERRPKYARVDGSIETFWQRPKGPIAGVLFLAHGCMHQAGDFFYRGTSPDGWQFAECDHTYFGRCLGLPEEREFVQKARTRNYLVVSVSGGSGRQSCWYMQNDAVNVEKALRHVFAEEGLSLGQVPILATGASSGGAFMGPLASHLLSLDGFKQSLRCIVPQISALHGDTSTITVPTFFLPMARDIGTLQAVNANIAALAPRVRADKQLVADCPVGHELQEHHISAAAQVVQRLSQAGLLDASGKLNADPRGSGWRDAIAGTIAGDSLVADESAMSELMNVAYAQHEFTAEHADKALDFCEAS